MDDLPLLYGDRLLGDLSGESTTLWSFFPDREGGSDPHMRREMNLPGGYQVRTAAILYDHPGNVDCPAQLYDAMTTGCPPRSEHIAVLPTYADVDHAVSLTGRLRYGPQPHVLRHDEPDQAPISHTEDVRQAFTDMADQLDQWQTRVNDTRIDPSNLEQQLAASNNTVSASLTTPQRVEPRTVTAAIKTYLDAL